MPSATDAGASFFTNLFNAPWNFACYGMANTVGYRLLYPGTLGFIQNALQPHLLQGRAKLVEEQGGRLGRAIY